MSLFILAAVASFACLHPSHHDGDAIHCDGEPRSMRLHAIDAPEMPGACRPGRDCTPGDPYVSRDYLASLTHGRKVECAQTDTDKYGRRVVECTADGRNLGCAMVAAGMAVERDGQLDCGRDQRSVMAPRLADVAADPGAATAPTDIGLSGAAPPRAATHLDYLPPTLVDNSTGWRALLSWPIFGLWLLIVNAAAFAAFAVDKQRALAPGYADARRLPESLLLGLAAIGGSGGAIAAQQILRHKTRKQPFGNRLLMIAGVHLGIILALAAPVL